MLANPAVEQSNRHRESSSYQTDSSLADLFPASWQQRTCNRRSRPRPGYQFYRSHQITLTTPVGSKSLINEYWPNDDGDPDAESSPERFRVIASPKLF